MTKLFENERVAAWDGAVNPASAPFEVPRPFFQPKGVTHKEERSGSPVRRKDTRWIPRGTIETEEAISGSPRAVTIELK